MLLPRAAAGNPRKCAVLRPHLHPSP
jgi:hypothetical protein